MTSILIYYFIRLSWRYFILRKDQIKSLSIQIFLLVFPTCTFIVRTPIDGGGFAAWHCIAVLFISNELRPAVRLTNWSGSGEYWTCSSKWVTWKMWFCLLYKKRRLTGMEIIDEPIKHRILSLFPKAQSIDIKIQPILITIVYISSPCLIVPRKKLENERKRKEQSKQQ